MEGIGKRLDFGGADCYNDSGYCHISFNEIIYKKVLGNRCFFNGGVIWKKLKSSKE